MEWRILLGNYGVFRHGLWFLTWKNDQGQRFVSIGLGILRIFRTRPEKEIPCS